MSPSCPACTATPGAYRHRLDGRWSILHCPDCGLRFTDPLPGTDELARFYADYRDPRAEPEVTRTNARDHLQFLARHGWTADTPTIDLGAGAGSFVATAGAACHGIDPHIHGGERLHAAVADLPRSAWGCLTLWGVLEHLRDPYQDLVQLVTALERGALVALTTIDAEGPIHFRYKPPEHLTYWTRDALAHLGRRLGLRVETVEPYVMHQLGQVYLDRLLARTPDEHRSRITADLPGLIRVPTNELRALLRKV